MEEKAKKYAPGRHPNSLKNLVSTRQMTKKQLTEFGRKGQAASVEVRKRKKELTEAMQMLLNLDANPKIQKEIRRTIGIAEDEEISNALAVAVAAFNQALRGNVKAIEQFAKLSTSETDKEFINIRKAELKIKREQHEMEMAERKREVEGITTNQYQGLPALSIAPPFLKVYHEIINHDYLEYLFPGGRGSTKSSFISLVVIDLIMENPKINALVMRQVANTLRGSVYNQLLWAIDHLGLTKHFRATSSPAEITRIETGQKIFFRGADEPGKIKSIKVPSGYIGILWFEELDQFYGPEAIRKIEQSAIRGGDIAWIFKSFNPPKSAVNWANKYCTIPKANRTIHRSDYREVPKAWLGVPFLEEAEFLKEINPLAYENEYLGVANGQGGNVFDNVIIEEISDEFIQNVDRALHGVDWGFYPDPYAYNQCFYNSANLTLYIYDELRVNKKTNRQTGEYLLNIDRIKNGDLVTCDSAEPKSVEDYRTYGIKARGADKGPGSIDYSMKWLQSLKAIIIDPKRCPHTTQEFLEYEYERDKEGNVISGYPDVNNHHIDAVRYATNSIWKKRGQ